MKGLSGVIAVLLLAACRNLEDPAPSQETRLVVHAILDTQSGKQTVLVYRARTGIPSAVKVHGISDDEPVADAEVSITGPNGIAIPADLVPGPSGGCCLAGTYIFAAGPAGLALVPGESYGLRIRTPLGEEATGTTTIPGPASLAVRPVSVFFPLRDTLRLTWPRVAGARSYEVIVRSERFGNQYRLFADTSVTMPGTLLTIAGDEVFPSGDDVEVIVSAVDASYYDYYRSQSDPFAGAPPSNLTGAVGVFGSIAPVLFVPLRLR